MIEQVTKWRDRFGRLYDSKAKAAAAEAEHARYLAVRALVDDGHSPLIRFASTSDCADWIVRNRVQLIEALS